MDPSTFITRQADALAQSGHDLEAEQLRFVSAHIDQQSRRIAELERESSHITREAARAGDTLRTDNARLRAKILKLRNELLEAA